MNTYKSNSLEQQEAEIYIFDKIQKWLGIPLISNPKLFVGKSPNTYMVPDFYSEEERIIGEIFVRIGKPKRAQDNKVSNDILKMLLWEKKSGKTYRKMIVVSDEEEERHLYGQSVLAECIKTFGIEVVRMELTEEWRTKITEAQKRQNMING